MRREATKEQWNELYEIAIKIKELKPWEYLWDTDTITLLLPEKEAVLCSVMGRASEFYGIGAYIGDNAISDFYTSLDKVDTPPDQMIRYQEDNVILCVFGSRDELTPKELKLIKELGFKFRGKNNWIYFHAHKKGYAPYILDQEEVLYAIEIFRNLHMSLRAYIEEGAEVDFENGNTLLRMYNPEEGLWLNIEAPIKIPEPKYLAPILKDEVILKKINKIKQSKDIWEFDISFLSTIINDKEYGRPAYAKICVIADRKTATIINQSMISPKDDYVQNPLNMILASMFHYKRPQKIIVRDEYLYYILEDLCSKINIKLEIKEKLNAIDSFLWEFGVSIRG